MNLLFSQESKSEKWDEEEISVAAGVTLFPVNRLSAALRLLPPHLAASPLPCVSSCVSAFILRVFHFCSSAFIPDASAGEVERYGVGLGHVGRGTPTPLLPTCLRVFQQALAGTRSPTSPLGEETLLPSPVLSCNKGGGASLHPLFGLTSPSTI